VLFSLALSVKMSVLLYLPGLGVILWRRNGLLKTIGLFSLIFAVQLALGAIFLKEHPWEYAKQSFDLSRVFLFKWTVNWRFLGEDIFLSPLWAKALLLGHLLTVLAFANFRWCREDGGLLMLLMNSLQNPSKVFCPSISADYVTTVLMTSNLIGLCFARSLHYQFYSWYAHQVPFLAWRTPFPIFVKLALILAIEFSWNIYPSSTFSSLLLVSSNVALLYGTWISHPTRALRRVTVTDRKDE